MPVSNYKIQKLRNPHKMKKVLEPAGTKRKRDKPGLGRRKNHSIRRKGLTVKPKKSTRLGKPPGSRRVVRKVTPHNEEQLIADQIITEKIGTEAREGKTGQQVDMSAAHASIEMSTPQVDVASVFNDGYREGYFEGGEGKVNKFIPRYVILPELSVDDVIATGIRALFSSLYPLMSPTEVFEQIRHSLDHKNPLSLIRLGDGELLTLAHETIIPVELAKSWGKFLPYAGVHLPDHSARQSLADCIRSADIVGIPESRHPSYQGLLFPVLKYYGMDYRHLKLTSSTVNYALNEEAWLSKLLVHRRIVLIGNQAPELSTWLQMRGYDISGVISPVQGIGDVQRIVDQAALLDFDIALVAAGIAAVIICTRIAREQGRVALDMGHLADLFVKEEAALL